MSKRARTEDAKPRTAESIETLSAKKLLHFVKKDELEKFVGKVAYDEMYLNLQARLGKSKVTLRELKDAWARNDSFVGAVRTSPLGSTAFQRYATAASRLQGLARDRGQEVRKVMAEPRRRYLGCLATKIQPEEYQACLDEYDYPAFDKIKLVPPSLKSRVYERTSDAHTRTVLAPSVSGKSFSDLPSGIRHYIVSNPSQFKAYFDTRRHELGMMKSVLKTLTPEQKDSLRTVYADRKGVSSADVSRMLGLTTGRGERRQVKGACEYSDDDSDGDEDISVSMANLDF